MSSAGGVLGQPENATDTSVEDAEAVVIGGGISGICLTRELKRQGLHSIVVLEKADQLGGTWHYNRYPGVACDIPSPSYSFSFRPHDWSRLYAEGDEIRDYFQQLAAENDVVRHVRFNTELLNATWDEGTKCWLCETSRGRIRSRILVIASGMLHDKAIPNVQGVDKFDGSVFHSAEWPKDFDPAGKRIAVVGTGASAIQFIPKLQPNAKQLVVLQRTPSWILPKYEVVHKKVSLRHAIRRQKALRATFSAIYDTLVLSWLRSKLLAPQERVARKHLTDSVADPHLRDMLTPDYRFGCKRPLQSNDFYPAIASNNVDYVASALAEVRPHSVVSADGREFAVDAIIWGTGFRYGQESVLKRVHGRDGRSMAEVFGGTERAYLATTMVGCPNAFLILGPNAGGASIPISIEAQAHYVGSAVETMRRQQLATVEVKPEAEEAWTRQKDELLANSVWLTGGCTSYYLSAAGTNIAAWPGPQRAMAKRLSRFDVENYIVARESAAPLSAASSAARLA